MHACVLCMWVLISRACVVCAPNQSHRNGSAWQSRKNHCGHTDSSSTTSTTIIGESGLALEGVLDRVAKDAQERLIYAAERVIWMHV